MNRLEDKVFSMEVYCVITLERSADDRGILKSLIGNLDVLEAMKIEGLRIDNVSIPQVIHWVEIGSYEVSILVEKEQMTLIVWVVPKVDL